MNITIFISNVTGRYYSVGDDGKTMNFNLNDALLDKIYEIFSDIEEKLNFEIKRFTHDNGHGEFFKTKLTDKNCFIRNNDIEENSIAQRNTDYNCKLLVKIESAFFNNQENEDDILCYPQLYLEECMYTPMNNRRLFMDSLELTITNQTQRQRTNLKKSLMKIL